MYTHFSDYEQSNTYVRQSQGHTEKIWQYIARENLNHVFRFLNTISSSQYISHNTGRKDTIWRKYTKYCFKKFKNMVKHSRVFIL